jgi:hypothetical protein
VQLDFDPTRITFADLLEVFWAGHHPRSRPWSRQYMAAVFYHTEDQRKLALASKARLAAQQPGEIYTQILPAANFYLAEDYHQKYYLRGNPDLFQEISALYPDVKDLIASTAAARLNGYVAGYGTVKSLQEELAGLGLSPRGAKRLAELVAGKEGFSGGPGCPLPRRPPANP